MRFVTCTGLTNSPINWGTELTIRAATLADVAAITEIYNHYITDSIITFEEEVVSESEMAGRIQELQKCGFPWMRSIDGSMLAIGNSS